MGLVEWRSGLGSIASQRQAPWPTHPTKPTRRSARARARMGAINRLVTQLCRPVGYLHTYSKSNTLRCKCTSGDLLSLRSRVLAPKRMEGGQGHHLLMEPRKP